MKGYFSIGFGAVLVILTLTGCVTTTNQTPVDASAAHDKRVELGMKYLDVGKKENARWQFSKALELEKNSAQAYQGIAMVHQMNNEMEPAAKAFKKALRLADKKNRSIIMVAYGEYLMELGRVSDACPYFEKAANDYDFGDRAEALFLTGQCAAKMGNETRMQSAYEHALDIDKRYSPALIELTEVYFNQGEYAKARRLLDQYERVARPTARSLWLGVRIERIFDNKDKEASYALALRNRHPYSKEYLEYKRQLNSR